MFLWVTKVAPSATESEIGIEVDGLVRYRRCKKKRKESMCVLFH
jgi:hypothetical protein